MLVVLRTVLGIAIPEGAGEGGGIGESVEVVLNVGTEGVEWALEVLPGVGSPEVVTDREGMAVRLGVVAVLVEVVRG